MRIFSITCTRDKKLEEVPKSLFSTLSSYGVHVKILANQTSIFEAYEKGLASCDADLNDIIILCHDDLEMVSGKADFLAGLAPCLDPHTGIVGLAGTTELGENAVWWDQTKWKEGKHRGKVHHSAGKGLFNETQYGPSGRVVALDGLFLAARRAVWEMVGLDKPEYFEGNWDFYDIHYTTRAHLLGYKNYAVPIEVIHSSSGDLTGRDSWHLNKEAFIKHTDLPLCLSGS